MLNTIWERLISSLTLALQISLPKHAVFVMLICKNSGTQSNTCALTKLAAMFEISDMYLRESSHVHQVSSSHNNQTLQQTHQRFPNTKLLETKHYNSNTLHMFQCLWHSHFVASRLGKIKIPAQSLLMDSNCQEALQNKNLTKPGQSIWIKKWRICCCTILFTNAMNRR